MPTIVPSLQNAPFQPCQKLAGSGSPFLWAAWCSSAGKGNASIRCPCQGGRWGCGGEPLLLAHHISPSPNPGMLRAVEGGGVGAVTEAQGPQRGMGAPADAGRALAGGRKPGGGPRGCAAGQMPVPSFPPLLTGCKVPGILLRGGSRSHPLRQGAEGSRRCQAAAGGTGRRPWTAGTAAVPAGHPDVLGGHPQDVSARWGGGMGSKPGLPGAGKGVPAPFEAPIKGSGIKGGESQRNKESG